MHEVLGSILCSVVNQKKRKIITSLNHIKGMTLRRKQQKKGISRQNVEEFGNM
jgi:hypothetical protein